MEKTAKENNDPVQAFRTPRIPTRTRGKEKLAVPCSSSSESENENTLQNPEKSPRRGRPRGSKTGSSQLYSPRPSRSRGSLGTANFTSLPEEQPITSNFSSTSDDDGDALHMNRRKRLKKYSNSSSQLDSEEDEKNSNSDMETIYPVDSPLMTGTNSDFLPAKKTRKSRNKKNISDAKSNENVASSSKIVESNKTLSAATKIGATKRRKQTSKKCVDETMETSVQAAVIIRQNHRGVLVSIDNTTPVNAPRMPHSNERHTLVAKASMTPTNTWNSRQVLDAHHSSQEIQSTAQPLQIPNESLIIVNNRLFKFDSQIPLEIQDVATHTYVNKGGQLLSLNELKDLNPPVKVEEISIIPMSVSAFYSIHGFYFGHKKMEGNKCTKLKRKGFEERGISDCFYVYCRLCATLKACNAATLANFGRHLKDSHQIIDPAKLNLGVMSVDEGGVSSFGYCERYKWDNAKQISGLDLLLQYMMDSNLPFANIEKFSLKRLLNFFDPMFKLPSANTLHALLTAKVDTEVIAQLKETLQAVTSATLIVDAWSSRSNQGVLAIKIVFLDDNFIWNQKTISIGRITGSHTAVNIGEKIKFAIKTWNLQGKIRFVVSDAGTNMVKCLADLHEELSREDLDPAKTVQQDQIILECLDLSEDAPSTFSSNSTPISSQGSLGSSASSTTALPPPEVLEEIVILGEISNAHGIYSNFGFGMDENIATLIHHDSDPVKTAELNNLDDFLYTENLKPSKCTAHTLQRVLAVGIQKNEKAMTIHKRIKKISAFGRKRQVVREITKALRGKVVIRPGLTRWNSVVDCGWSLYDSDMFNIMRSLVDDAHDKASDKMRKCLPDRLTDEFFTELKEFLLVSDPVCKLTDEFQANGITAHLVIPGIARTYEAISTMTDLIFMEDYRQVILRAFEEKMMKFVKDKDFVFATVLCPFYKMDFFEVYFEENPFNALQIPSLDDVKTLCLTHLQTSEEMESTFNRKRSQLQQNISTNCSYAHKIQERAKKKIESVENTMSDFSKYISDDLSGESPMDYWQRNKSVFPVLFDKAREIFCKPASSGLVERLFSLIGDINTADRVNLHVKTIEEIIMYKEFLNLPKTYREATKNIFSPTDDQLVELVKKLSVQHQDNIKKPSCTRNTKKPSSSKRSSTNPSNNLND